MDPELLDLVWEVYQKVGAREHIYVVSSYRSPATNNMLRKRSRGVAKNSQHTLGKAMDFYIPGVNLAKLRATGLRKQVGGVGYYPALRLAVRAHGHRPRAPLAEDEPVPAGKGLSRTARPCTFRRTASR